MLAKPPKPRRDKVYRECLLYGKMRIWQQFSTFVASVEEMLAKLAKGGYSEGVSAITVFYP